MNGERCAMAMARVGGAWAHGCGAVCGTPIDGRLVATNKNVAQAKSPARGLGKKSCSP